MCQIMNTCVERVLQAKSDDDRRMNRECETECETEWSIWSYGQSGFHVFVSKTSRVFVALRCWLGEASSSLVDRVFDFHRCRPREDLDLVAGYQLQTTNIRDLIGKEVFRSQLPSKKNMQMCHSFFFAKADLVRDLRPLALPCCSNDYGGAKSGGKRISLRKGEIWRQQSVQNSTSKQEFMYMYRSAEE